MLRTRAGDVQAFAMLVDRYRDAAYGIALHVVGKAGEATEVAQDAFFRAYRCLHQLREPKRFSTWLCRLVMNLARNRADYKRVTPASAPLNDVDEVPDPGSYGSEPAEASEFASPVWQLVQKLSNEERVTFALFYVHGYTERDISEILGVPFGTVKRRLSRGGSRLGREIVQLAKKVISRNKPGAAFWRSATGVATGRVTSAASGVPIEGAEIKLYEPQTAIFIIAKSGPEGIWKAAWLVPGAYSTQARHPDFISQTYGGEFRGELRTSAVVRPGQTVRGIDLQLEPRTGSTRKDYINQG